MKKLKICLGLTLLLAVMLTGCQLSFESEEEQLPDEVIVDRERYKIERIDGACYVDLKGYTYEGCVIYLGYLVYDCVEDMRETFINGSLDEYDIDADGGCGSISYFRSNEQGLRRVPDPYNLLVPSQNDELTYYGMRIYSDGYEYQLIRKNAAAGSLKILYEDAFEEKMQEYTNYEERFDSFPYKLERTERDEKRDATVYYYYDFDFAADKKAVAYTVSKGKAQAYVLEHYTLNKNSDETVPNETTILMDDDGVYFSITITRHDEGALTEDEIMSFEVEKYQPED